MSVRPGPSERYESPAEEADFVPRRRKATAPGPQGLRGGESSAVLVKDLP